MWKGKRTLRSLDHQRLEYQRLSNLILSLPVLLRMENALRGHALRVSMPKLRTMLHIRRLAALSSVYFQRDTAVEKSQLIEADAAGAAGGMAMGINTNGAPDAYIRGVGGTPVILTSGFGDVQLDRAYTLIFKWGTGGMALALYNDIGALVRPHITSPSTIGLSGTSTVRFGATHNDTNHHDGPYGRVIWMNRRITDAEELILAQASTIARSAGSYRGIELNMGPLSLWGMGDVTSTIQDAVGTPPRNGSYNGVITQNAVDLPDNSIDGAIDFAGTGSGTVPHSAAFVLPAYTLSFWFVPNIIPDVDNPSALPLICKCASSGTAGDFACFLASTDGDVLRVRVRDAANTIFDISSPNDTIRVGERYHVCIRGDNTGVALHLNGKFTGKATGHTIGWGPLANNTQPLQFAHGLNFTTTGNCALDEICLFPRVITVPEIAALAQRTVPPVAVGDDATVFESAVSQIIVLDNDEYVGIPTIEIITQPSPDSVAIISAANTLPYLEYTAGAVSPGGAARSFSYRISDVNGTSNTATCTVTVQDSGFVADSIANCYTHTGGTTPVDSMAALEIAINSAAPGAQITIDAGTYGGATLALDPQGTEANPIVVRPTLTTPNNGRGSVTINDAVWNLATTSRRLVITNLNFNNAQININGQHHRVARCQFRDLNHYAIRVFTANDTRISHCDFAQYRPTSITDHGCIQFNDVSIRNQALQRALVDYCHMHDITQTADHDPTNVIQVGTAGGTWPRKVGIIIDHCLIADISRDHSSEVIVCKTSEVTIRYCTLLRMNPGGVFAAQYIQQRQGAGIEIRSCWSDIDFLVYNDVNVPAPVRDPLIIGNRMVGGANILIRSGNDAAGQGGAFTPGPYHHCVDGRVIGNTLQDGFIIVGTHPSSIPGPPFFDALNNNVVNVVGNPRKNTRLANPGGNPYTLGGFATGTTFVDDTAADYGDQGRAATSPSTFTPAQQLDPNDVGVAAPDPLCPSGPQN